MSGTRWWLAVAVAPFLLGVTCGFDDLDVEEETMTAELRGEEVVPPVETDASGRATAHLVGSNLTIRGSFANLRSDLLPFEENPVMLREGAPGENGSDRVAIPAASVDRRTGTFELGALLEAPALQAFQEGLFYVVVRTVEHPDGELRAQLR